MISAPPRFRPMLVAALLGFVAETLSLIRVAVPHTLVFDEVHYVPAARTMLALATPVNTERPLLGKAIIADGLALFGAQRNRENVVSGKRVVVTVETGGG